MRVRNDQSILRDNYAAASTSHLRPSEHCANSDGGNIIYEPMCILLATELYVHNSRRDAFDDIGEEVHRML